MATVNLGSIKFNWKGTYVGATAYKIDDVVEYNGSSYISIQAGTGNLPTDTAYWELMSQKGTNGTDGTDLGTTLTTQGDIVYRDASGLQRLGAGTSGQVLQTNGTGANPSWGTVSSDWVKLGRTDVTAVSSISFEDVFTTDYDVYKVFISNVAPASANNLLFRWLTSGSTEDSSSNYNGMGLMSYREDANNSRANANDAYTGSTQYQLTQWGQMGDSGTWSGMNNFELTLYDPKRNHKSSSAKGGNIINVFSYMYNSSYQVNGLTNLWHNTTGTSYNGFKLYYPSSVNFQAIGTISLYGIKA